MQGSVRIIGWGESPPNPDELVTNDQVLEALRQNGADTKGKTGQDTEDLIGIRTRWISDLTSTQHAEHAALIAMAVANKQTNGNFSTEKLDLIYSGGSSPDFLYPATACDLHGMNLPEKRIEAFDISLACTSFMAAVCVAKSRMRDKGYRYGLISVGEQIGKRSNAKKSLNNCLWGTGGGAVVLEYDPTGNPNYGILDDEIISDGKYAHWTRSRKMGYHPIHDEYDEVDASMEGHASDIQRYGLRDVSAALQRMLDRNARQLGPKGRPLWLITHNANWKMQLGIGKTLGIPEESVLSCIKSYGNTSSASIPITLAHYANLDTFQKDDLLLMAGFGGGMSMGLILYRW